MIIKATIEDIETVKKIVHETINAVYPGYYPQEVIKFFLDYHNEGNITQDILSGNVYLLVEDEKYIGTGTIVGEYMNRVYVLPMYQGQGYGAKMMTFIEDKISEEHDKVLIDSSLPALKMYIRRGYSFIEYKEDIVGLGQVLCYQVMQKNIPQKNRVLYNLNNRVFKSVSNTENGEVSGETIFRYYQETDHIWASYSGGDIRKGFLIGKYIELDKIYFTYQHINKNKEIRNGKCRSKLEYLPDGRLCLHESWQWLDSDKTLGSSVIEEVLSQ